MRHAGDDNADRERELDRSKEREPTAFRARRLPPRAHRRNGRLADIAAGLLDGQDDAGVLQPPVKVVAS